MSKQFELEHALYALCNNLHEEAKRHSVIGFVFDADVRGRFSNSVELVAHVRGLIASVERINGCDPELLIQARDTVNEYISTMHLSEHLLQLAENVWHAKRASLPAENDLVILTQVVAYAH